MTKFFGFLIGITLWLNVSNIAQDNEIKDADTEIPDNYQVDLKNKKIQFDAELISSKEMLEVLACTKRGPTHEAVFLIPAIGKKLHGGLKSIGLNDATKWQLPVKSGKAGFDLSLGNKVFMKVYWEGQKESDAMFIEDLLVYKSTQVPMMLRGWTFKGDLVTKDGKKSPIDDAEISLINKGRKASPVILLLNPSNFLGVDEPEYVVAKKYQKLLKPMNNQNKKRGTIVIQPATESQLVEMNLKRYPNDQEILKKNIPLAKEIDQLKEVFINKIRNKMFEVIKAGSDPKITKEKQKKLITEYKEVDLESQVTLNRIHYLYHLMMVIEFQVINKHMDKKSLAWREFNLYSISLIKCISKEKSFIAASFINKSKEFTHIQKGEKVPAKKARLQIFIDHTNANIQRLLFRPILLKYRIDGDETRLKEKDVIESVIVKAIITKGVKEKKLEKIFFELLIKQEQSKVALFQSIQKDLSKEKMASTELVKFKNATIDTCLAKLQRKLFGHKSRIISLKESMEEFPREKKYYVAQIKKSEDNLIKDIERIKNLEASRKSFGTDTTDCFTFEKKYQDLLKLN